MRRTNVLIVVGAAVVGLALLLNLFTGGAFVSRGHHMWLAHVTTSGDDAPWEIELPLLRSAEEGEGAEALETMLAHLRVTRGEATLERDGTTLRIAGKAEVIVEAKRTFWRGAGVATREAFLRWDLADTTARRLDGTGPERVGVVIELDHSGGAGHTCWASATYSVGLARGASGELLAPAGGVPPAACA